MSKWKVLEDSMKGHTLWKDGIYWTTPSGGILAFSNYDKAQEFADTLNADESGESQ